MQYLSFYYFNIANLFCFIRYGSTDKKKKKGKIHQPYIYEEAYHNLYFITCCTSLKRNISQA